MGGETALFVHAQFFQLGFYTHKLSMQLETVGLLSHIRVGQLSLNRQGGYR